jgi:5,10-methylenetetrahydromethanopterin reductase
LPRTELGLLHLGSRPAGDLAAFARRVEDLGYDALWISDEKFYRDPFVSLAVAAQATTRLRLGTGVTEPYARHPALIAMAMGTVAELCPGRCFIGLGAGGPGFPPMGVRREHPVQALTEAIAILRGLLAGERVDVAGSVVSFRGGRMNFPTVPLPIYVAARGRRMLRAAGAIADGVVMAPFASADALDHAIGLVRGKGAGGGGSVGRDADGPKLIARVDVCVAGTRARAREAVRYFVALPLWVSYPDWGYAEDLGIRLPEALRTLIARREYGDIAAVAAMLPEAMTDHFAVAGTESDVAAQLAAMASRVGQVLVHPVASPDCGVDELVATVARIWRSIG